MKELTLEEAALAWAQGKRVEAADAGGMGEFYSIGPVGSKNGRLNPLVFNGDGHRFRLAPETPAKKFRQWTPGEVPVGARFRFNNTGSHQWIITGWNAAVIHVSNPARNSIPMGLALSENCEHSLDNGKTWLPCGVEVDA